MLINIRGTSGAGKSTLVRQLMEKMTFIEEEFVEGRKQALYSLYNYGELVVAFIGHYNTQCGGVDTLKNFKVLFDIYENLKDEVDVVIAEGKMLGTNFKESLDCKDLVIFELTTSMEDCHLGIQARREAKGEFNKPRSINVENNAKSVESACRRLKEQGKEVYKITRENGLQTILNLMEERCL